MIGLTSTAVKSRIGKQERIDVAFQIEEGTFKGYDGSELFFQTWAKSRPTAVILGVHGLGEHSDSYKPLAEGLKDTSFQLIMSDLRGHGRSSGKRGVGTIDEYIRDLKLFFEVVRMRLPGLPIILLGHSMGGLTLLKFLVRNGDMGAAGCVLSSPLLGVTLEVSSLKLKSAKMLAMLAPNLTLSNEIVASTLSHDSAITSAYEFDHWRHDRVSARLYLAILKDIDYVFLCSDKIQLPILIQQAGDDLIVSQSKAADFFQNLKNPDKKLIVYKDYYHEIYNEVGRGKVFADLIQWLEEHLSNETGVGAKL